MKNKVLLLISVTLAISFLLFANVFAEQIDVIYSSSKIISLQNSFQRLLSVDQDIAVVEPLSSNRMKITGVGIGETFVYVWWDDNSYSVYKVSVKPARILDKKIALTEPQAFSNLKLEAIGVSYGGQSDSIYQINRWAYGGFFSGLRIFGKTNVGETNSYIHYEGYNGVTNITRFSLNLKGDDFYIDFGDGYINLSEVSLPYLHYQGFQLRKDLSEQISLLLVSGARGQGYWGKDALRDTRPVQKFSAFQATLKPIKQVEVSLKLITSTTESIGQKSDIIGVTAKYSPDYWLTILGDAAKSGDDLAFLTQVDYNYKGLFLRGQYKSIPSTFVAPSDYTNLRGVEGIFLYGSHTPFSFLRLSAQANRYKNNYLQMLTSEYNSDISANIDLIVNKNFSVTYSPWQTDQRGFVNGGLGQGALTQATYSFMLGAPSNVFLRFQPSKFTNSTTAENDYLSDKTSIGCRIGINDSLSIDLENEWATKDILLTSTTQSSKFFKATFNFNSQLGSSKFYNYTKLFYSNGIVDNNPATEIWGETELSYKPTSDAKFYIKGKLANYSGVTSNVTDRSEKHLVLGFNTVTNLPISFANYVNIQGFVFIDRNGNGIKDKLDEGIENAKVYTDSGMIAYTNKDGWYEIKNVNLRKTKVFLDLSSVDNEFKLTTQNPVDILSNVTLVNRVDFGLKKLYSLKLSLFVDKNNNKIFDVGEKVVAAFPVFVNGEKYVSDYEGKIFLYDIKEGTYKIQIDPKDLSERILPLFPLVNEVEILKSGITEYIMPFKVKSENISTNKKSQTKEEIKKQKRELRNLKNLRSEKKKKR